MNDSKQRGIISPFLQNVMPVGNKKKITGYIPIENLIPIQTEKDELIVLPTNDVVKVNAKKRHSKMSEDQVTDIVPDGSYVLSQYGKVDIYKKEADNIIIETENKPYNLYNQNPEPKVKTLGDMMNKNKMKPADLARKILAKYKTVDHDDPFTEQTNRANKYTASKYLQAIVSLSELDKQRKGLSNEAQSDMFQGVPEGEARQGGLFSLFNLERAQQGGSFMNYLPGAVTGLTSIVSDLANRNLINKTSGKLQSEIESNYQKQMGLENQALGANLAGFAVQDPRVELARKSIGDLQGLRDMNLSRQNADYMASRMAANRTDYSMYPPQVAAQLAAQDEARRYDAISGAALQDAKEKAAREREYLLQRQAVSDFNADAAARERMGTRERVNQNLAGMSGAFSGSMGTRQGIEEGRSGQTMQNISNRGKLLLDQNLRSAQNAINTASLLKQGYASSQNEKQMQDWRNRLLQYQQQNQGNQTPLSTFFNTVGKVLIPGLG